MVELKVTRPDLEGAGTPESDWRACQELQNLRPWSGGPRRPGVA